MFEKKEKELNIVFVITKVQDFGNIYFNHIISILYLFVSIALDLKTSRINYADDGFPFIVLHSETYAGNVNDTTLLQDFTSMISVAYIFFANLV